MRRALVVASMLGAAAVPMTFWLARPHAHSARAHHAAKHDDDRMRGPGTHRATAAELVVRDRVAKDESLKIEARQAMKRFLASALPSVPATTWVNLGPTDAPVEVNYHQIMGVDSGRPNAIVVDPRDPNVVYVAVSGGGLWKSFDFLSSSGPTWNPAFDTRPNLAIGALALDPDNPDTIYVGSGDFVDGSGDTIFKSTDGGGTWSDPVQLAATLPDGTPQPVGAIRQISVQGGLVLAATDAGLFSSADGLTFKFVDLPNQGGMKLAEALWSVAPLGNGAWVASGVTACDTMSPPPGLFGSDASSFCTLGNNAAIWTSVDGASWTPVATLPVTAGTGRTTVAAGPNNTVYAYVGSVDGFRTVGFWRSTDAGVTWKDATGTLANPTAQYDPGNGMLTSDCGDMDVGHSQSWYNQAIVVDPTNADHVLVGGNLCGVRTLNGTADSPKWELVSHWLPGPDIGATQNGILPYVHADWHTATSVNVGGQLRTFAGTDGGVFSSTNVFDKSTAAEQVVWTNHNRGLATHLMYSVASGDPATGNPFVVFAGLQDNGTRFRADIHNPSAFNQPIGGDGIGATVHSASSGTTYWGSVEFGRYFCKPAAADCSTELPDNADDTLAHWHFAVSPAGMERPDEMAERAHERAAAVHEDSEPFLIHYSNVETDTVGQSVLTHSDGQVFVAIASGTGFVWQSISQDLTGDPSGVSFANVVASRGTPDLYGAVGSVSAKPFFFTTHGNSQVTWTLAMPVHPLGDAQRLTGPASMDFPPVLPTGTQPGQVFIGSFTGTMIDPASGARLPPPDDKGHLYRTSDFGQTWTSIVGADPAHRLPNVPVYVVKYDPVTPTTIYAGTDVGVYISLDDGATWDRMGDELPMVPVRDMYIAKNQEFIRVSTYGRGLWEIYPSSGENHGALGNGDYDRNLRLDWIDVAAMATRLGVTPATTTQPYYSWILDMSSAGSDPPVAAIDESDLTALLAKFGGHP